MLEIDPILPKRVYARVLEKMLLEIEHMSPSATEDDKKTLERLVLEAEGHYLNTLVGWGSSSVLIEYIKLYKQDCSDNPRLAGHVLALEDSLKRRREQTSACYLRFPRDSSDVREGPTTSPEAHMERSSVLRMDALYDIDNVISVVSERVSVVPPPSAIDATERRRTNSRVALDAVAKLSSMKGAFDDALRYFLMIGAHHPSKTWEEFEDEATSSVNDDQRDCLSPKKKHGTTAYGYVLSIIESHHLHQYLLTNSFLFQDDAIPPLYALLRLVGLELLGEFLIEHCVAPQTKSEAQRSRAEDKTGGERRGTLPIDLVARQLESSPKLLHWYLHLVFTRKPSVYVIFPNTANPPPIITSLHRSHIDLYIKFAGKYRDSSKALEGIEAYRVSDMTTPLLAFLKVRDQLCLSLFSLVEKTKPYPLILFRRIRLYFIWVE